MKYSSPTLLLLLAAAASNAAAHQHSHMGPARGEGSPLMADHHDHHHHGHDHEHVHVHEMLKNHVRDGEGAQTEGGGGDLLHAKAYYLMGFLKWTAEYGASWSNVEDAHHALMNYARADDKIHLHNAKEAGFTMSHNAYSHLSWEEFRDHFSIGKNMVLPPAAQRDFDLRPRGERVTTPMLRGESLPDEVDWVTKGGVTEVKNQGSCGSCWSFSTTGSMEGAYYIKTGELAVLSEQELVDCDTYDMGCNGGLMDYSFHWIQQNGGICSEKDYPYTASGDLCKKSSCETVPGTMVDKWVDVDHDSEEALMAAVAQQPVSIAIEADEMSFQLYSGGVLTAACGTNLDHGVLLVGYGVSEDGIKYWKVKNSWGAEWGADGYILLKREAAQEGGECGILEQASYPVLA